MISRGYWTKLVWRRTMVSPNYLSIMPLASCEYSISIPKVSHFRFPSNIRSEYQSNIDELISANVAKDVQRFSVSLNKAITIRNDPRVLDDVCPLFTLEFISTCKSSDIVRMTYMLGSVADCRLSKKLQYVCSGFVSRMADLPTSNIDILNFLDGLSKCHYDVNIDPEAPVAALVNKFGETPMEFSRAYAISNFALQMGLTWNDLKVSLLDKMKESIRSGVEGALIDECSRLILVWGKLGLRSGQDFNPLVLTLTKRVFREGKNLDALNLSISDAIHGLGLIGIHSSELPVQMKRDMISCLNQMTKDLTVDVGSSLIHSLGLMNMRWKDVNLVPTLTKVLDPDVPSVLVVDALVGITAMGVTKRDLSLELQDALQSCLAQTMKRMSSSQITTTVTCLGKLKVDWNYLNRSCQESIVSGMREELKQKVPLAVAQNIQSLSRLGVHFKQLASPLQSVMDEALTVCIPKMDNVLFSETLYHLGKLKMVWQKCSTHLNVTILNSLPAQLLHIDKVPTLLYGLGSMGVKWKDFQPNVKPLVFSAVQQSLEAPTHTEELTADVQLSWIVQSLVDLKIEWSVMPESLRSCLFSAIKSCTTLNNASLCMVLSGLAQLQLSWSSLPANTSEALLKCLHSPTAFSQGVEYHISSSIWALGVLQCDWNRLPFTALQDSLVKAAASATGGSGSFLSGITVSRVLWSLGQMGVGWSQLNDNLKDTIKSSVEGNQNSFNMRELTSAMQALAILTFDSPCHTDRDMTLWSIHYSLVKTFRRLVDIDGISYSEQSQMHIYLELLRSVPLGCEMLKRVLPDISKFLTNPIKPQQLQQQTHPVTKMSSLHSGVVHNTKYLLREHSDKFRLVNEYSGFDSGELPVDLAVFGSSKLIALVEFDGEHHYTASGELRRSDQLKEYLYSVKFPGVPMYRIKNSLIQDRGFQKTGNALTLAILMALEDAKVK